MGLLEHAPGYGYGQSYLEGMFFFACNHFGAMAHSFQQHVMLDKDTGLDPPGIKLRAAQGFDATDFFVTGYVVKYSLAKAGS